MLTEREIFDRLTQSLKRAISLCNDIARQPKSGPQFIALRAELKLVEGACRQAAVWREDTRWLAVGIKAEQAHQYARIWLDRPTVQSKKLFTLLAAVLRRWFVELSAVRDSKVGRSGIILPESMAPGMPEQPRLVLPDVQMFSPRPMPAGLIASPVR